MNKLASELMSRQPCSVVGLPPSQSLEALTMHVSPSWESECDEKALIEMTARQELTMSDQKKLPISFDRIGENGGIFGR